MLIIEQPYICIVCSFLISKNEHEFEQQFSFLKLRQDEYQVIILIG